jgi:cytochrome oxidase Cu insertion factor (SCO1/SenC/PrrC family)
VKTALCILALVLLSGCTGGPLPPVGAQAPNLILTDIDGDPFELHDWKGKVILLEMFGVRCGSCRAMMGPLLEYHAAYASDDRVRMVSIDAGSDFDGLGARSRSEVAAWREEFNATWTFIHDPSGEAIQRYPAPARPTIYLIAPDGQINVAHGGYAEGAKLQQWTENLLRRTAA